MQYLIEIVMTHEHYEGRRLPDCFQAMFVPLSGTPVDGEPEWDSARPLTPPVLFSLIEQDTGLGQFLELIAEALTEEPERIEWSLEGPDNCVICDALAKQELVSQGRLA